MTHLVRGFEEYTDFHFKGTVARDFRPLVFFMNGPNKDP
jgi:hypothetical protein